MRGSMGYHFHMAAEGHTMKANKIQAAEKQLDRALANLDRVANYLEDAGLSEQAHMLDGAGEPVEQVREILAAL
jgi:hypothetical protein